MCKTSEDKLFYSDIAGLSITETQGRSLSITFNLNEAHWTGLSYLKRANSKTIDPNAVNLTCVARLNWK